ncbi:AAA family ATPase [Flavobacterium pectinovorum]|uniref:Endonuclease GajA/Old nuclease/RecF-like AAA domain-containing protein n=1 Tax=Flavobacterium pectinovorum TaxID=29533 RepID=A0A502EKX7_9FLAO|nr:AAA family ATPase [Flavobacterium pectinovorum]TPG38385.1 hypothetical protein EAH81_15750 [Flavobacterium pectinovorum]
MNFKIIALKVLDGTDSTFVKVLKKNKLYFFYTNYKIEIIDGIESIVEDISLQSPLLYNIKGLSSDVNINISAIVGKNGSGKSTIIDLLFRAINNIAYNFKFVAGNKNKTITADLEVIKGIHIEFYFHTDNYYKISVNDDIFQVFRFNKDGRINLKPEEDFSLEKLFYTEAVNYSHYAYNSKEYGYFEGSKFVDWLQELFHKNDSYQTPLVLNPMRTEGNFDINRENDLVKQRILANVLRPIEGNLDFRKFGDNLIAHKISFELKKSKDVVYYHRKDTSGEKILRTFRLSAFEIPERNDLAKLLMSELVQVQNFNIDLFVEKRYLVARSYIIYKVVSICLKYEDYFKFLLPRHKKFDTALFGELINKLKEDDSHITFKLKQVLNYLKNDYVQYQNKKLTLPISDISDAIALRRQPDQSILNFIPPPIFDIKIILKSSNSDDVKFDSLSSGEKQLIYMVSSLLYHLYNIDSVMGEKIKYENINIVLEEIELYFHPELQRCFIKYFLDSISRIGLKNIKSINICFVTHSPFILSDIPSSNIMFLKVINGEAFQIFDKKHTFGANIHELLGDSFFMENGYIGSFAQDKINDTINWINKNAKKKESKSVFLKNKIYHQSIIKLIDEPILKIKLSEMLSELDKDVEFHNSLIQQQIDFLVAKRK